MLGGSVNAIGVLAPTVAETKKRQTRFEKEGNEEGEGGRKEKKKRKKEGGDQAGIASLDNNNTYRRMTADSMWKLPSGAYVEDVLRNAPGLARSFVIDILDPSVEKLFDPDDWPEILAQVPPWPDVDQKLVTSMERFWDAESPAQLRKILGSTSFLKENEQYNRAEHYDLDWIDLCFRMLLPLYEDPDQILLKDHNEQWYTINIWSVIVDRCLQNLSGITLRRGETTSIESTARRNRDRVATTRRKRLGARFDGLAQDNNGQLEYLAMETSKTFDGETSSKWLCDTRKVAKSLHGMLYRLQRHVKQDGEILREMHMAGLVSAGLHCQVLRMTYAKGHVCILSRDQLLHVPTTMEPRRLCPLLLSIWRMKMIARKCKDSVAKHGLGTKLSDLLSPPSLPSFPSLSTSCPIIPPTCDTESEMSYPPDRKSVV